MTRPRRRELARTIPHRRSEARALNSGQAIFFSPLRTGKRSWERADPALSVATSGPAGSRLNRWSWAS